MNKKIFATIILLLCISLTLSGCTENNKKIDEKQDISYNSAPVASIKTNKDDYYFGEPIDFDASESYDSDGKIVSYNWDFGDRKTAEGVQVNHIYQFEDDFDVSFPIIYTVILYVLDDSNSMMVKEHQIRLFVKDYKFYFNSASLTLEKPSEGQDFLEKNGWKSEGLYSFENSTTIQKCKWNATIYLSKPIFAVASKICLSFYDKDGVEILSTEKNLGINNLWTEKTVELTGNLEKSEEIELVKVTITGFSLRNKINILTGGQTASFVSFNFID